MKKLAIVCLTLAAVVASGKTTVAAPGYANLTLTTDSSVNLFVSALSGTVTALVPFDLSGSIDITANAALTSPSFNDTTGLAFSGADISLSDQTVNLAAGFLGGISAEVTGAGINSLTSNGYIPLNSTSGSPPFTYSFDPGAGSPTQIGIDEGLFTYLGTGPVGGVLGSGTVDFGADPVTADIPSVGQIGLVTQSFASSANVVYITVSAPITFADSLLTDPVSVDVDLTGVIVATGFFVPEPSSVVLLGIAILGLIPMWRRIRK